jgi:pyruvate ferredoxin oxidoreductase gamma subunit
VRPQSAGDQQLGEPDCVIVIDSTLVHQVDVFAGLSPGFSVLVNSTRTFDELGLESLRNRWGATT